MGVILAGYFYRKLVSASEVENVLKYNESNHSIAVYVLFLMCFFRFK